MREPLYHIVARYRWDHALREGTYDGDTLAAEGFIHASTRVQLAATAARHYAGRTGLVVLAIDPERVGAPIRWELAPGTSEVYPHVYGPLDPAAVIAVTPLEEMLVR